MKGMHFLIMGFLLLPSLARADNFALSGYTEVGERSTAEDYFPDKDKFKISILQKRLC